MVPFLMFVVATIIALFFGLEPTAEAGRSGLIIVWVYPKWWVWGMFGLTALTTYGGWDDVDVPVALAGGALLTSAYVLLRGSLPFLVGCVLWLGCTTIVMLGFRILAAHIEARSAGKRLRFDDAAKDKVADLLADGQNRADDEARRAHLEGEREEGKRNGTDGTPGPGPRRPGPSTEPTATS